MPTSQNPKGKTMKTQTEARIVKLSIDYKTPLTISKTKKIAQVFNDALYSDQMVVVNENEYLHGVFEFKTFKQIILNKLSDCMMRTKAENLFNF